MFDWRSESTNTPHDTSWKLKPREKLPDAIREKLAYTGSQCLAYVVQAATGYMKGGIKWHKRAS
jgi:hypothetical protein